MDAVKRASFASKQLPSGPAPLASFEDLPSDELESPDDSGVLQVLSKEEGAEEGSSDCNTLISSNTPDTCATSNLSTPQIESDFDSHCTLTPVESKTHPTSDFRAGSLSSLSKEDDALLTKHKKGSAMSLGNYEIAETEYNQRKSSWTDIFRSHNQNSKSSSDQVTNLDTKSPPVQKKKGKADSSKKDSSEVKTKERNKIFGIFKPGKKGKNIDAVVEDSLKVSNEMKPLESILASEGKENEQPKSIELLPVEFQNDLDKSSTVAQGDYRLSESTKENDLSNNLNILEKECNESSHETEDLSYEKTINEEISEKELDGHDQDLSDSELTFDLKDESKKEDDFEKENLISQDLSEIEEDSSSEQWPLPVFVIPQQVSLTSRQQRLEVTTVPIERPRSTTPINVAPLEAFIRCTSPSFDPKMEKIKLVLPGEQFLSRMKSPKRNTAKNWADFCEEGLHSPRLHKKDDFHLSEDALDFNSYEGLAQDKEWVTFDSKMERDIPDLFAGLPIEGGASKPHTTQSDPQICKCMCECHTHGCENSFIKVDEFFSPSSGSSKVDAFSDKCQCQCHEKYVHLWSPTDTEDLLSDICDTLKSSHFSSDFASFSTGQFH